MIRMTAIVNLYMPRAQHSCMSWSDQHLAVLEVVVNACIPATKIRGLAIF